MNKGKLIGMLVLSLFLISAFQVSAVSSSTVSDTPAKSMNETSTKAQQPAYTTGRSGVVPINTFDVRIHGDRYVHLAEYGYDSDMLRSLAEQYMLHRTRNKPAIDRNLTLGSVEPFIVYEASASIPAGRGLVFDVPFTLKAIGDHCYVWVHTPEIQNATNDAPHIDRGTGIINQTAVDKVVDLYDNVVFPTATANFGNMHDVDDDPRIHIMLYDIAPDQDPSTGFTSGFHTWLNDDPPEINPYWDLFSNQAEMIFLDTYPTVYEAHYDADGDGTPETYYNMWDDAAANLNGWTTHLMNKTNLSGTKMPVVGGEYTNDTTDYAGSMWDLSVTSTGLTYWEVMDKTNYTLNTNDDELAVTGYYGFTGSQMLYVKVTDASWDATNFFIEELYQEISAEAGNTYDESQLVVGGAYELNEAGHVYNIKVTTGGLVHPTITDLTDYGANELADTVAWSGAPVMDEDHVFTIDVITGGNFSYAVSAPTDVNSQTETVWPEITGDYVYDEDLAYYVNVTSGGTIRPVLPETASGGTTSEVWNGTHFVSLTAGEMPEVTGSYTGTEDLSFIVEVVTGGMLGIDAGVSIKFSTDGGTTWSATKTVDANYPTNVLDSEDNWLGFSLDFTQYFYKLTAGDQFTVDAKASDYPMIAFSNDGTNYGDPVAVPMTGTVDLNGSATGLKLDYSGAEELFAGDIFMIDTVAYDAPFLEFSKDGGDVYANVTLTEDGFDVPYNATMASGVYFGVDNFAGGYVVENDTYVFATNKSETVAFDFGEDGTYNNDPVDYTMYDDPVNITVGGVNTGLNVDFSNYAELVTDDIYHVTVINGTQQSATVEFSNDGTTWGNTTTVTLDNLAVPFSDQADTEYGTLTADFSDFSKLVVGDQYNISLTGEANPEVTINGTPYTVNTTNPTVPMGMSGLNVDFSDLDLNETSLEWNVTIGDVTLNDYPTVMAWDGDLLGGAIAYTNQRLIENANDWADDYYILQGMHEWAIYLAFGLDDPVLQNHIQVYLKYADGQTFTDGPDHPWYTANENGQAFLFMLYLYEHYGGTPFIKALATNMATGWDGIEAALAKVGYRDLDARQIYKDFQVAVYVDDMEVPNKARYQGAGHQYYFESIDLLNFEWMEPYTINPYSTLASPVLTEVSLHWYITYWYQKYGGAIPITGWATDASDGEPFAGSSEGALARYLGASPRSYETVYYEFQNIPVDANLDLFFDGVDEQLFMDYDSTGPGDMWWSGDSKGANPDYTGVATEPDNKYLYKEVPEGTTYLDWWAWYQLEDNWDFVQLEVSMDSKDGVGGTWYSLPWILYSGTVVEGDYATWLGNTDWSGTLAFPSEPYYGIGDNNMITGSVGGGDTHAEMWNHYWTYVPAGAAYVRFRYMTDWGTQYKGMWVDHIEFQDAGEAAIDLDTFTAQADEGWAADGNVLADGSVISGAGWVHPPASATPNNFMVVGIATNMDNGFATQGAHQVFEITTSDVAEVGILQRLASERLGDNETLTLMVIPTTDSDKPSEFTAGLYDADGTTAPDVDFTLRPDEGKVEGSLMFQWDITTVNPETVYSVIIKNTDTGEEMVYYSPGTNIFVWRAMQWPDGTYEVTLRATYLDFNNMGLYSPYYEGQSRVAYSPTYTFNLENAAPVIDAANAKFGIVEGAESKDDLTATYSFNVSISDSSDIYSAWIYYSDDGGEKYTLAILNEVADGVYGVEFEAAAMLKKEVPEDGFNILIDVHAQDVYNLKAVEEGLSFEGDVYKPPAAPGFEAPLMLLSLVALAAVLSRRRR